MNISLTYCINGERQSPPHHRSPPHCVNDRHSPSQRHTEPLWYVTVGNCVRIWKWNISGLSYSHGWSAYVNLIIRGTKFSATGDLGFHYYLGMYRIQIFKSRWNRNRNRMWWLLQCSATLSNRKVFSWLQIVWHLHSWCCYTAVSLRYSVSFNTWAETGTGTE